MSLKKNVFSYLCIRASEAKKVWFPQLCVQSLHGSQRNWASQNTFAHKKNFCFWFHDHHIYKKQYSDVIDMHNTPIENKWNRTQELRGKKLPTHCKKMFKSLKDLFLLFCSNVQQRYIIWGIFLSWHFLLICH